jgi:hypothetical protein
MTADEENCSRCMVTTFFLSWPIVLGLVLLLDVWLSCDSSSGSGEDCEKPSLMGGFVFMMVGLAFALSYSIFFHTWLMGVVRRRMSECAIGLFIIAMPITAIVLIVQGAMRRKSLAVITGAVVLFAYAVAALVIDTNRHRWRNGWRNVAPMASMGWDPSPSLRERDLRLRRRYEAGGERDAAARAMVEMRVEATVDGGQPMTVNVNGQHMSVMVPPHVRQGEPFSFQIPAPEAQIAVAQGGERDEEAGAVRPTAGTAAIGTPNALVPSSMPRDLPAASTGSDGQLGSVLACPADDEQLAECPVCLEPLSSEAVAMFVRGARRTCPHYVHARCAEGLESAATSHLACPVCRVPCEKTRKMPTIADSPRLWFAAADAAGDGLLSRREVELALASQFPISYAALATALDQSWSRWDHDGFGRRVRRAWGRDARLCASVLAGTA